MKNTIPVAILGATGSVGQRFVQLLDGHPWFHVTALTGSARSVGKTYANACHWIQTQDMPEWARTMKIVESNPEATDAKLAFSALPSSKAKLIEPEFAQNGIVVCSNASAFRMEEDVPLLLPEVNPDHTFLLNQQHQMRGWSGGIVTNPNCTSTGMTVALKALEDAFGISKVFAVSLQALSGAGLPGVAGMDILDNIIPYIDGEEEKVAIEPKKMLGKLINDKVVPSPLIISAHTNRVAVSDGHVVCLSIKLEHPTTLFEAQQVLENYQAPVEVRTLPSAPQPVIIFRKEPDRPQPRLDRSSGRGMSTIVGRLREDPIWDLKMVVLSHNTVRGAAGGSIYNAELLVKQGYV